MSWHKQQEYDPTTAFLQNNRQQKLLELRLEELDRLWFHQLKQIARDKLEMTLALSKMETEKQKLKYFDVNMDIQEIKEHGEEMAKKLKKMKTEAKRDNFNFDLVRDRSSLALSMSLHLPKLPTPGAKGVKRHAKKQAATKKKTGSKLHSTRVFSVSDSNLHKSYKATESDVKLKGSEKMLPKAVKDKLVAQDSFSNVTDKFLPLLRSGGEGRSADSRYLRNRMATVLALPPLTEVTQRRKLSI